MCATRTQISIAELFCASTVFDRKAHFAKYNNLTHAVEHIAHSVEHIAHAVKHTAHAVKLGGIIAELPNHTTRLKQ